MLTYTGFEGSVRANRRLAEARVGISIVRNVKVRVWLPLNLLVNHLTSVMTKFHKPFKELESYLR